MDPLFSYTNVHTSSFNILFSLFYKKHHAQSKPKTITMATITPALTTTQLLTPRTEPCVLPQQMIDLSMLLQNNSKIPVCSSGVGHLQPLNNKNVMPAENKDPPAAQQPKRPAWTESHAYLRGSRTNGDNLRILATEINMIRASKITRSLKPRRPYSHKREDPFVWGKSTSLRISCSSQ
ncbi:hypothetical protein INT47_008458 [Mucor saturninus]|uniref:Uncharacterized protein n=1 Tax=Mucor saturninus TaxID=64648 RepID=A0A8H7R9S4_9FUNG|nr:hypothetical protein INT47_008458 [Mucor saturninus]